jgi:hypothetical protein
MGTGRMFAEGDLLKFRPDGTQYSDEPAKLNTIATLDTNSAASKPKTIRGSSTDYKSLGQSKLTRKARN